MYLGRILAISRAIWQKTGGFRSSHEPARDYDLALRATETALSIEHIPRVLYSRRKTGPEHPPPHAAAASSLIETVQRRGLPAAVEPGPRPGTFCLRWKVETEPLVSLIICSRSPSLLDRCLTSLAGHTAYGCRELLVVQHLPDRARELQAVIERHGARRIPYEGVFHFSRMNNLAAQEARGSILLFLNDDTEILDGAWLERLIGQVERPDVGIAGARLLYPSGNLQHGGVAIGIGDGCAHIGRDTAAPVAHWPWLDLTRDVSAVTGACLAIRAAVFRQAGGFAEEFPVNYNDIDLCLRVRQAGYRVIYDAGAVLRHAECQSRRGIVTAAEQKLWFGKWSRQMEAGDPFYSANLTRLQEDLSLGSLVDSPDRYFVL